MPKFFLRQTALSTILAVKFQSA